MGSKYLHKLSALAIITVLFSGLLLGLFPADADAYTKIDEKDLHWRTNIERTKHGYSTLLLSDCASRVAREHAAYLASIDRLEHTTNNNAIYAACGGSGNITVRGEVIARNLPSDALFQQWMDSPLHHAILDGGNIDYVGVGTYRRADNTLFGVINTIDCWNDCTAIGAAEPSPPLPSDELPPLCQFARFNRPRPNGALIANERNGALYILEDGKRRYIGTVPSAATNSYDFKKIWYVYPVEVDTVPAGKNLLVREGTLVKAPSNPSVYLIDETLAGYSKRLITSETALNAFGLKFANMKSISDAELAAYTAGSALYANSPLPDGLLMHQISTGKIFLTEASQKRLIGTPEAFVTNGFSSNSITTAKQSELAALSPGPTIGIRAGTIVKKASSAAIYVIDYSSGIYKKRPVGSMDALLYAGFYSSNLRTIPAAELDAYPVGSAIAC